MSTKKAGSSPLYSALLIAIFLSISRLAIADSCDIRVTQTTLDFGPQRHPTSSANIGPNNLYPIGNRSFLLSGNCQNESNLMLILRGINNAEHFLFADHGRLTVRLSNASLDGRSVELALIKAQGESPGPSSTSLSAVPGSIIVPVISGSTASGKVLSIQVEVLPSLSSSDFSGRDARTLKTNLSFELRQL